jgi:glutathione synthase/RimK-type ligase-like ATP-grasp enzyme
MDVPHVPTYIFYDKHKALDWVKTAEFPKVFKLSKGAGSANVRLVKTKNEAEKLINIAFGKGFKTITYVSTSGKRKITKAKSLQDLITNLKKIPGYLLKVLKNNSLFGNQKGYIYFQNFIEGNDSDTRIVVIGNKSCSIVRNCPPCDFRASGSGIKDYTPEKVDKRCVEIALNFSKKNGFQSMAYDFIYKEGEPVLIEMSYCFETKVYPGYYDEKLEWHKEKTEVYKEMIDNLINK